MKNDVCLSFVTWLCVVRCAISISFYFTLDANDFTFDIHVNKPNLHLRTITSIIKDKFDVYHSIDLYKIYPWNNDRLFRISIFVMLTLILIATEINQIIYNNKRKKKGNKNFRRFNSFFRAWLNIESIEANFDEHFSQQRCFM
jgi:hypothetical protein